MMAARQNGAQSVGESSGRQFPSGEGWLDYRRQRDQHKACDVCKRRKVRCSGTSPCQQCLKYRSDCVYTSQHGRVTALERQLRAAESRMADLERAWATHLPDVDLEGAITSSKEPRREGLQTSPARGTSTSGVLTSPSDGDRERIKRNEKQDRPLHEPFEPSAALEPELDTSTSEALEWNETPDMLHATDGIGSLTLKNRSPGYGYMGPQSGNSLLRYLQSVGNFLADEEDEATRTHQQQEPPVASQDSRRQAESSQFRNQCVDWYFLHFHKAYPILHEGCFRAQYMGALPKPRDGSWPLLLNIVLALGAFAGPESSLGSDLTFYERVRAALPVDILYRGSLHLVQALSLLANYLQKRNMPNSGFTFLGIAHNMALGLGLNREFSDTSINTFTRELRRRVWWTLYIFDSGARLTFGRPSMTLTGINVRFPQNLDDSDLEVDMEKLSAPHDHPTATSSLIWQSRLAKISNEANAQLLVSGLPRQIEMLALEDSVSKWWQSLPDFFKRLNLDHPWFEIPRMVLLWRSQHLRIVICRPFLLDVLRNRRELSVRDPQAAVGRCLSAAEECSLSISAFVSTYQVTHQALPGSLTWYATYWLVTAVFIHVTCIVYDPSHSSAGSWRVQINGAMETLQLLATYEPLAGRASTIISKIMSLVPASPDMTTVNFNEAMRMGIADMWNESWYPVDPLMNTMSWTNGPS